MSTISLLGKENRLTVDEHRYVCQYSCNVDESVLENLTLLVAMGNTNARKFIVFLR